MANPLSQSELESAFAAALTAGALPGEVAGFDPAERDAAAAFVAEAASVRQPGTPAIRVGGTEGEGGRRRMRIAVVNDDMPFLVDSVAAAIGAHGLAIERLLHPVLAVRRDEEGRLIELLPADDAGARRESLIYLEVERADARLRRDLEGALASVLEDVRRAVGDWPHMQTALREDAARLPDGEGAALLRWFLERHFTLLGHAQVGEGDAIQHGLGVLSSGDCGIWTAETLSGARAWFAAGGEAPLILKGDVDATVHRRVPIDLLIVPVRDGSGITGLSIHAGLWTSAALRTASDKVPVLRARLAALEERYGFAPTGHAGKALRHVLSALPHDLLVAFDRPALELLALTAMSLADRPRPKLVLVHGPLRRHLFAFVWLPRDDLSTARRVAIGEMIAQAAQGVLVGWSLELDDAGLALIRYQLRASPDAAAPDMAVLDRQLSEMLRGWAPAVEAALVPMVGATRGARLALQYAGAFPVNYRNRYDPAEAADDVLRIAALNDEGARATRLVRGEAGGVALRLKTYRQGGLIALSDAVPVLENFGFRVLAENATALEGGRLGTIHDFLLEVDSPATVDALMARAETTEQALAAVLEGRAENDEFNRLIVAVGLDPQAVVLFRAWFRYLRQTGLAYGLATVVEALRRAPAAARGIIDLFCALHDANASDERAAGANAAIDAALAQVSGIDDDRILRRIRAVVQATLRTNAFSPARAEALAFKLDSKLVPGLPAPVPWREIWVYSPRVEGIHLRSGPIARGGLRWSDRRDDFRTEILGLMKAQVVKNAVIVPTGAKGGFYPKALPSVSDRDAWMAEGTESYRIFIRSLLSVTDNIVEGRVVHPEGVTVRDGEDPYFVVAADKGTASFSDVANALALERGFWLGDAFASGGSQGYDHKAMAITARGAWVSVQRHFAERGVDVQSDSITVVGCGDMSGDVFGNGMLLSKALKLVAAFDHRHIFLDPDPDPASSWAERERLFNLPRSSWADYDAKLISAGGGIFPRTQKAIPLSVEAARALGVEPGTFDPSSLIAAILKAPADLLWFGGIGTYVKAKSEGNAEVGDPANDAHRITGDAVRATAIGEGANLGVTQAGRIAFALNGGRLNTDFIDNSAGVDCSDNEVNIKIALNAEMAAGRLSYEDRNVLLREMTDEVAALVLEDNRLQTLALSLAERGGAAGLPAVLRAVDMLEAAGRIDRAVDGLGSNEELSRRVQDGQGLTRPELAIVLSHVKLALQAAIETTDMGEDPALRPLLHAAFPRQMQERFAEAIDAHRLRGPIVATELANRVVNRIGLTAPLLLAEEEGVSLAQVAAAYAAADLVFGLEALWTAIETAQVGEAAKLDLFEAAQATVRLHMADLLRAASDLARPGEIAARLGEGIAALDREAEALLRDEARAQADVLRQRLAGLGAPPELVNRIVRLDEMDGAAGIAGLAARAGADAVVATRAYVRLGEALALDWAKSAAVRFTAVDPWERLLAAGVARDLEQVRLDFLAVHADGDMPGMVERWIEAHAARIGQFRALIDRARAAPQVSAAMLAQISNQARLLLGR
ncbi:NAD-glutamate dehydrogenase domain-containing protein [Sphingomonas jatrophae]|uniref:Glutamate dehydrogenase n=1 Tax=Sphingomonas jatrophae TaxID=1166337 RepID=A0A1I6M9E9_9SPHN|nr:NAD-glutamate dehydrogenase domain-containing protein [Sphingomonas jatrophae]SFS12346.1 glutamate dehydrogenase [Sphingomonas jatrophae]